MRTYERFITYAKINTRSDFYSGTHPSFEGEFKLAELLGRELEEIGMRDVKVDEKCYVYAFLPPTEGCENAVPIGFISHIDTSPEAPGENVCPVLHENYDGSDVILGISGRVLKAEKFPFLEKFIGETLITSDGTTLLGADDKAGVAEIVTAMERIQTEKLPHGPLYVCFTPDEEIGAGADYFDLNRFKARYAYTVDGGDSDCIEYENFNAAMADLVINGVSVHPGNAKNVMINAQNAAFDFHNMLPIDQRPENTDNREGYIHLREINGSVAHAELKYLIRDHDSEKFREKKALMIDAAAYINKKYGSGTAELKIEDSYYNMYEIIKKYPDLIEIARQAVRDAGMEPQEVPVRGGTDGARLSYMGLPCPNLGTGGYNFHGEYECTTVERLDRVTEVILNIIRLWSKKNLWS